MSSITSDLQNVCDAFARFMGEKLASTPQDQWPAALADGAATLIHTLASLADLHLPSRPFDQSAAVVPENLFESGNVR